jgi:threonine/homoserine/homoserine lactone efflux protein
VPDPATILAFGAASLALLVIPGPAVIYIVNRSIADGRRVGLASVAGIELGNFVHVLAAVLGLSAVLATSAIAFTTVKWLGAAYLIYVGIMTLRRPAPVLAGARDPVSPRRAFAQGIVVNTFNPKVALFFLSFLPQFIDPDAGRPGLQALVLGMVFVLLGFLTDGTYALVASGLREALLRGPILGFVQRYVAGAVFIGLGVLAALSSGHRPATTSART